MTLFKAIIFFVIIYFLIRLIGKVFSVLTDGRNNQVKGPSKRAPEFRKKQDIEDADYEELH